MFYSHVTLQFLQSSSYSKMESKYPDQFGVPAKPCLTLHLESHSRNSLLKKSASFTMLILLLFKCVWMFHLFTVEYIFITWSISLSWYLLRYVLSQIILPKSILITHHLALFNILSFLLRINFNPDCILILFLILYLIRQSFLEFYESFCKVLTGLIISDPQMVNF